MILSGMTIAWRKLCGAAAPPVRAPDPPRPVVEGMFVKRTWLPSGKKCAVVFTIDDVHPARSTDAYEAGGDLDKGALRHVAWLLERHPELRVTLFVTPDWRQISPFPTRKLLSYIPVLSERLHLAPTLPKGTMSLERHPDFVAYLKALPRTDFAPHGLHHYSIGPRIGTEFQQQSVAECQRMIGEAAEIFERAGLPCAPGHQAPLWHLTPSFIEACARRGLRWLGGGRDLFTAPSDDATSGMNGPLGASMMHPTLIAGGRLVLFTTNFQATSDVGRAFSILDQGGVLAIKGHIIKRAGQYVALDGIDEVYRAYLDALFRLIKDRYGTTAWFTSMDEIAEHVHRTGAETCNRAELRVG
jgi:hypothetical protein